VAQPQTTAPRAGTAMAEHEDPAEVLFWATDRLQMPASQRTAVTGFEDTLRENQNETTTAFGSMFRAIANQVRAGSIDPSRIEAEESAAISALQVHVSKEADALNGLHGELDAGQRATVVSMAQSRESGRTEAQPGTGAAAGMPSAESERRKLDAMTRMLSLDTTQQQQIFSIMQAQAPAANMAQERRQRMERVVDGFQAVSFDARTLLPTPAQLGDMVRQGIQRHLAFLNQVLLVLRPDQREKLAASIESGGMHDQANPRTQ
jgi:Spy/CpxP family protein refolding chaperone